MGVDTPEGFCESMIDLIPKMTNPNNLKNSRLISLTRCASVGPPGSELYRDVMCISHAI
jgi:hypothetical protein